MEPQNIPQQLHQLQESLSKMKALLAWEQLKLAEARPGDNPGFTIQDSLANDLRNHYLFFAVTSFELHGDLVTFYGTNLAEEDQRCYLMELRHLEGQFRALQLDARFKYF